MALAPERLNPYFPSSPGALSSFGLLFLSYPSLRWWPSVPAVTYIPRYGQIFSPPRSPPSPLMSYYLSFP